FFVFFFQAEDGIRDDLVTGVQTCALPISAHGDDSRAAQHDCALWRFARHLNDCLDLLDVRGFLLLLLLGGLVSGHLLLRGGLPLVRLRTARRSLVSLGVLLLFVRFFLLVLFLWRLERDAVK